MDKPRLVTPAVLSRFDMIREGAVLYKHIKKLALCYRPEEVLVTQEIFEIILRVPGNLRDSHFEPPRFGWEMDTGPWISVSAYTKIRVKNWQRPRGTLDCTGPKAEWLGELKPLPPVRIPIDRRAKHAYRVGFGFSPETEPTQETESDAHD